MFIGGKLLVFGKRHKSGLAAAAQNLHVHKDPHRHTHAQVHRKAIARRGIAARSPQEHELTDIAPSVLVLQSKAFFYPAGESCPYWTFLEGLTYRPT